MSSVMQSVLVHTYTRKQTAASLAPNNRIRTADREYAARIPENMCIAKRDSHVSLIMARRYHARSFARPACAINRLHNRRGENFVRERRNVSHRRAHTHTYDTRDTRAPSTAHPRRTRCLSDVIKTGMNACVGRASSCRANEMDNFHGHARGRVARLQSSTPFVACAMIASEVISVVRSQHVKNMLLSVGVRPCSVSMLRHFCARSRCARSQSAQCHSLLRTISQK